MATNRFCIVLVLGLLFSLKSNCQTNSDSMMLKETWAKYYTNECLNKSFNENSNYPSIEIYFYQPNSADHFNVIVMNDINSDTVNIIIRCINHKKSINFCMDSIDSVMSFYKKFTRLNKSNYLYMKEDTDPNDKSIMTIKLIIDEDLTYYIMCCGKIDWDNAFFRNNTEFKARFQYMLLNCLYY